MQWWTPSTPKEIKPIPWLAPEAIQYLENIIRPDMEVLEFGAGGSTLWFAERVKRVTSYEKNREWFEAVVAVCPDNVRVLHPSGSVPYERLQSFDLIFIDGEPIEERAGWIKAAEKIVKLGGWIILDNANRPEYEQQRRRLQTICKHSNSFDSNKGGTLYLVTEFFKMKGGE